MISIEEITDDNEVAASPKPGPGQEETLQHLQHARQDPTPAQPSTDSNDVQQPVEKAEQGNSEEDVQAVVAEAELRKQEGNALFKQGNYADAAEAYGNGLTIAPDGQSVRAILYANRAACYLELQQFKDAVKDCSSAIDIDGSYLKAWHRRAKAHESLDDMDRALQDLQKVQELQPSDALAVKGIARLQPIVAERQEKMKDEMLGKLKELGNTVLGKFGMSLDNFKAEKDPNTGSYSINFKQ